MITCYIYILYRQYELAISDRGVQFVSEIWKYFYRMTGTKPKLIIIYYPEANGQTKITNKEIERYIRTYCNYM
jgi:hypothetical protein